METARLVTIGEKGQITIPKKIRNKWNAKKGDKLKIVETPGTAILIEKLNKVVPESKIIEFIRKLPPIDFERAWRETLKERRRSG